MWDGQWGYVTGAAIFLLLALGQYGQYRHDRSDVRHCGWSWSSSWACSPR